VKIAARSDVVQIPRSQTVAIRESASRVYAFVHPVSQVMSVSTEHVLDHVVVTEFAIRKRAFANVPPVGKVKDVMNVMLWKDMVLWMKMET
jgi:hypothetical protein